EVFHVQGLACLAVSFFRDQRPVLYDVDVVAQEVVFSDTLKVDELAMLQLAIEDGGAVFIEAFILGPIEMEAVLKIVDGAHAKKVEYPLIQYEFLMERAFGGGHRQILRQRVGEHQRGV